MDKYLTYYKFHNSESHKAVEQDLKASGFLNEK